MPDDAYLPRTAQVWTGIIIHELLLTEFCPIRINRPGECVGAEGGSGQNKIRNELVMGVPLDDILEHKASSLVSPFTLRRKKLGDTPIRDATYILYGIVRLSPFRSNRQFSSRLKTSAFQ